MSKDRATIGRDGESVAANWYLRAGWEIEARNWRCREGELDLVVVAPARGRGGTDLVVVCEVKTRSSSRFGGGAEAVTPSKQRRVRAATRRYLSERVRPASVRFDVAVVERGVHGYAVRVIEGAF